MRFYKTIKINSLDELIQLEKTLEKLHGARLKRKFSDDFLIEKELENGEYELVPDNENPFIPGIYFAWVEETWDRSGDTVVCVLQKIEENPIDVKTVCDSLLQLEEKYIPIAKKADKLRQRNRTCKEKSDEASPLTLTDEEFDFLRNYPQLADEMGYSPF